MAVWFKLNARELSSTNYNPTAFDPHFVETVSRNAEGKTFIVMRGGKVYMVDADFDAVLTLVSCAKDSMATNNMTVFEHVSDGKMSVDKILYKTIDKPSEQS